MIDYSLIKAIAFSDCADQDLDSMVKTVLLYLALHRDKKSGQCNPSMKTIADMSGFARSTLILARDRLIGKEVITTLRQSKGKGSNWYQLNVQPSDSRTVKQSQPSDSPPPTVRLSDKKK